MTRTTGRHQRLLDEGRYAEAIRVLRAAIRRTETSSGRSSLEVAGLLNDLGVCYKELARFSEAGLAYQRALNILERRVGHEHADVATLYHNLGGLEHAAGNGPRGEPFARESVRIRTRLVGSRHPDVAADKAALAALLSQQKNYREAEALYDQALAIYERTYGPHNVILGGCLNNLAAIHQARGRRRRAETMYRRALAIEMRHRGPNHPKTAFTRSNLAALLMRRGRLAEAARLCRDALATFRRQLGHRHPNTAVCLENYAAILRRQKRGREAAAYAKRAERIWRSIDGVNEEGVAATGTINPLRASFRLIVLPSRIHRFGVFAEEVIPAGRRVIEYIGERLGRTEGKRRWNPARSYLFQLDSYWTIDGAIGGSGAEYINHSCDPNVRARLVRGRIFYFSKRRIAKGEELTNDYKYDARLPPIPCRCGARSCRGTINLAREQPSSSASPRGPA